MANVLNLGALGDGVHDDWAGIQAALDQGGEVVIPQGVYPVSRTLRVRSDTTIRADKSARIVMRGGQRKRRGDFLLCNADPEAGNENIAITGGIWDGSNQSSENAKPDIFDENGYSGVLLNFMNVEGLSLKSLVLANSVTYYTRMCRVSHFTIEDIDFVSDRFGHNQDGLHFGGECRHGRVKNIRALSYGQTNDDLIALNADDCLTRVENRDLVCGDIEDIELENISAESCHTIVRLASVDSAIRDVRFKNVWAGFRCNAVNADAARYCRTPLFREADKPHGVGRIENVTFEGFRCHPAPVPAHYADSGITGYGNHVALQMESGARGFVVRDFRITGAAPEDFLALRLRNLENHVVLADGERHVARSKEDVVELRAFGELRIDREK